MARMTAAAALAMLAVALPGTAAAQENLDMTLEVTDGEKTALFAGFVLAVAGIAIFLARDVILRRKTDYDAGGDLGSKTDRTFEKYHSGWGDDYEELGQRGNTDGDREIREAAGDGTLPDYYGILGVAEDATRDQIKKRYRELAKKTHPDKTGKESEEEMAMLNKAYEVLSDGAKRNRYDAHRRAS